MADSRVRKRAAVECPDMPDWAVPLQAHKFMHIVGQSPEVVLTAWESPGVFCEWLWEERRRVHLMACEFDESGSSVGWCTLSRMIVLSARVRRHFDAAADYAIQTRADYRMLARMGLCISERRVHVFDLADVRITVRLICTKWCGSTMWSAEYPEAVRLIEMLLYDLGLRMEELWNAGAGTREELVGMIRETARTTASVHAILAFMRTQIEPRTNATDDRFELLPNACIPTGVARQDAYVAALECLEANMEQVFRDNMRLGSMTEELCACVQIVTSPLDTKLRARAVTGLEITDNLAARRRVISVNEYVWDMTKMPGLTADAFLDPSGWDLDNGWLIRAMAMVRVASIMISQYNAQLQWAATCILVDRDLFKAIAANGFSTTPPVMFIHAARMVLMHGAQYYMCESIAEGFLLWCCILHREYDGRLTVARDSYYDLKKELGNIFDICCPRTAEQELADADNDREDAELSDGAQDLLAALGIGSEPEPATQTGTFLDPSDIDAVSESERARRERIDALFANTPDPDAEEDPIWGD